MNYVSILCQTADETMVIAGDIFDVVSPSSKIIALFVEWLCATLSKGVKVVIMPGNHDATVDWLNTATFNGLMSLSKKLLVVTKPGMFKVDNTPAYILPHIPRDKITDDIWKELSKTKAQLIIGHAQIGSSIYGNDCFFESGKAVDLSFDYLPDNVSVILGHEHDYATYRGQKNKVVTYPGSVVVNNYGEVGDKKGFIHITVDVAEWQEYPPLKYPYLVVDIDLSEKDFEYTADDLRDLCNGFLIKVVVTAKDAMVVDQVKIQQTIAEAGGTVTRFETKIIGSEVADIQSVIQHDHVALLEEYLKQGKLGDLVTADALKLGTRVIEGVSE